MIITANSAVVFVRMDPTLRKDAEEILNQLGISPSTAVQMFYKQIILKQGLPFSITLTSTTPLDISKMNSEQLNYAIQEGLKSLKCENTYTQEQVDKELSQAGVTDLKNNITYSKAAVDDIKDIYSHITFTLRVPKTAKDVLQRIRNEAIKLSAFPELEHEKIANTDIRKLTIKNYVVECIDNAACLYLDKYAILYQVQNKDSIAIIRVCYAGRENVEELE